MSNVTAHTPAPWFDWENGEWLHETKHLLASEADACLIAVAPDLYEACADDPDPGLWALAFTERLLARVRRHKEALAELDGQVDIDGELGEAEAMCKELRAAIARAEQDAQ